jgi:hypothetical protein
MAAAVLPGERANVATTVKALGAKVMFGSDRSSGFYGEREVERLKATFDGLMLSLSKKHSLMSYVVGGVHFRSASDGVGATLEVEPETLLPEMLADVDVIADVIPSSASFTWSQLDVQTDGSTAARTSVETLLDWDGSLGDTSAFYWREAKEQSQQTSISQMLDVSHTVRWGHWRLGVGALLTDYASPGAGATDISLSGNIQLTYEVINGPSFRFRVGHDLDRSLDDSFESRRQVSDIALSLDLSSYVRKNLDQPDAHLTLEFRQRLDESVEVFDFSDWDEFQIRERSDAEGLLLSFGMRL